MDTRRPRDIALAAAFWLIVTAGASRAETFDVILRGGTVVDGTGAPGYVADIAVRHGHIARIGDLSRDSAPVDLPAGGLVVAPGFINIHGHPEASAAATAVNMLTQGVTTEIGNADGLGDTDLRAQLARMSAKGLATNLGLYIGFNAAWLEVMGSADRRASASEVAAMRRRIADGMAAGAWGVSAGLDYKPAFYAQRDEVVGVVSAAAPWRTNFPNHERLSPATGYSGLVGMRETVDISVASGLTPVITHMKSQGAEQGRAPEVLALLDGEPAQGRFAAGDIYPYLYGFNNVRSLLIPAWALDGGTAAFRARMHDPATRARLVAEVERIIALRFNGPSGVYVASQKRELTQLMAEWGVSAGEAVLRLNEQYGDNQPTTYLRFGAEEDLVRMLRHPQVAVACDCGSLLTVAGHPRAFGTFPRVLGHYVRETGLLSLEEAIRKMSGLPASVVGLVDRGWLAPGMAADVTVFDPRTIRDRGDPDHPELSQGVVFVLVNGRLAVRDGATTGAQGGVELLRSRNMPTRPAVADVARRVAGRAELDPGADDQGGRLAFDLKQSRGEHAAQGRVVLKDSRGRTVLAATQLGVLQVSGRWATLTGRARLESGESRAFTLILDGASPDLTGGQAVTLFVEGQAVRRAQSLSPSTVFHAR